MSVEHVTGDLFAQGADAIGHGVNCRGVMGAGIAVAFRQRFPAMYAQYRVECREHRLALGGVFPWRDDASGLVVYNLASQDRPGRHATLAALRSSLTVTLTHAERVGVRSLALPRIGCGIGGLLWEQARDVIEDVASRSDVRVLTVTLPT